MDRFPGVTADDVRDGLPTLVEREDLVDDRRDGSRLDQIADRGQPLGGAHGHERAPLLAHVQ